VPNLPAGALRHALEDRIEAMHADARSVLEETLPTGAGQWLLHRE